MKEIFVLIATLVVLAFVVCGCEESEPKADRNAELIVLNADAMVSLETNIRNLAKKLNAAADVNGINLNLFKRVSGLETDYDLYGKKWYENHVRLKNLEVGYDPNDAIFKFIPEAGDDWLERFGTGERTRLIHTISEIRVVVAAQGNTIKALDARLKALEPADPNEVKE